jgi:hypothetical protein
MKANASQFVIWNGRGNQRVRPWGRLDTFDTFAEAERTWDKFKAFLRDSGIVPPHVTILPLAEVGEGDPALAAMVRGPWNNAD